MLAYRMLEYIAEGRLALAPWQRGAVWSEAQRLHLLDSLMRGISVGAITIWDPPTGECVGRPFGGFSARPDAWLVADGQQRITTLLMAAAGDLDHWRWNGLAWHEGPGYMTPSMAVRGATGEHLDWFGWLSERRDKEVVRACVRDLETIAQTDLHLMVLDGPAEHMIETYRRLATCGSPHSPDDLAEMERWLAAR